MRAFYDPVQAAHDPEFFLVKGRVERSKDSPERAKRLLAGLSQLGLSVEAPRDFGMGPIAAVHSPEYLAYLTSAYARWQALPGEPGPEVVPNIHPNHYPATYPKSVVGQTGWHMSDTNCAIGPRTWEAVYGSAHSAITAAAIVMEGAGQAYALCRPPGHHAFGDMAGGSCFLNNSAIAAQALRAAHARVAILDIDVHHGNGTQGIFYNRADVLTVSIHRDPHDFYPFHWGHEGERGAGAGEGYNLNLTLPAGAADDLYLSRLDAALERIALFAPTALVVAAGLDASEADPYAGAAITSAGFARIGAAIAALDLPTVYCQEGGYVSDILSENIASFLGGACSGSNAANG
ncbi:histone deacetylase family protein [Roseovarius sp. C7]|uniref:histone deacetylase family protein n=1 Tax=Roseovarius sp. C7 TaxID=3398643 RepID=UPI0039F6AE2B